MRWIFIFVFDFLLIFGFSLEDGRLLFISGKPNDWNLENLCKRKPYLIFCREQSIDFNESRMNNQNQQVNSRPRFKSVTSSNDDDGPLERPLQSAKEHELGIDEGGISHSRDDEVHGHRSTQKPIDLSRPNAEDVAREMGELQRDTTTTESNEVPERVYTTTQST